MKKNYLSLEEELELGRIIKAYVNGDKSLKEEAFKAHDLLFEMNKDNVYSQISKFRKIYNIWSYEYEDAIQDGLLELSKRIWEYDPDFNCKCYTRIHHWVHKALQMGWCRDRSMPISTTVVYQNYKINKTKEDMEEKLGREVTLEELSKELDIPIYRIDLVNSITSTPISLDHEIAEDKDNSFIHLIEDPNVKIEKESVNKFVVEQIFEKLTPKEQDIIKVVFGFEYIDLNQKYGIYKKSEIRKLAKRIIEKTKFLCKRDGLTNEIILPDIR